MTGWFRGSKQQKGEKKSYYQLVRFDTRVPATAAAEDSVGPCNRRGRYPLSLPPARELPAAVNRRPLLEHSNLHYVLSPITSFADVKKDKITISRENSPSFDTAKWRATAAGDIQKQTK